MSQPDGSTSGPEKDPVSLDPEPAAHGKPVATGPALVIIITGLALAAFLIARDTSIVATVRISLDGRKEQCG